MSKVDRPGYRGKVRQCPSCEGQELIGKFRIKRVCETCFGSGVVYQGTYCPFCGRSPQLEYNGLLICGTDFCKGKANTKSSDTKPITLEDYYKDEYSDMYKGLI